MAETEAATFRSRYASIEARLDGATAATERDDIKAEIISLFKQVEGEVKKYVDESVPLVRERALKLAPLVFGPMLEEKFTEDELKQLIAWFESPINKKFQQLGPEMQNAFVQKLLVEARPVVDPKLQALDARLRVIFGSPPAAPTSGAPAGPRPAAASAPAPKASAK